MSVPARDTTFTVMSQLKDEDETTCFHHGDCVGSDLVVSREAKRLGYLVHAHPSFLETKRAFSDANDIIHAPKDPIDRNEDIAMVSKIVIATPHSYHEIIRSGTWTTIRRARKFNREICIVFPDGSMRWENSDRTDGREVTGT